MCGTEIYEAAAPLCLPITIMGHPLNCSLPIYSTQYTESAAVIFCCIEGLPPAACNANLFWNCGHRCPDCYSLFWIASGQYLHNPTFIVHWPYLPFLSIFLVELLNNWTSRPDFPSVVVESLEYVLYWIFWNVLRPSLSSGCWQDQPTAHTAHSPTSNVDKEQKVWFLWQ